MDTFWDWFWLMLWWFFLFAYLIMLFQIVSDLFRDRSLNGWWKALWVVLLILLPLLSALVYLIARGRGMAERHYEERMAHKQMTDDYIRSTAGTSRSAADDIAQAKALLDSGAIDATEFAQLKAKALT
ncbi:SHOCT domain-containing protein [Isoptericola sp. NPDC057653]|uniref:SHOCT domain-containing protein n=1 Tax=unclassified Isoptericola TaxID=2623355 RepID=UPI00369486C7